jgi:hypothetical protein
MRKLILVIWLCFLSIAAWPQNSLETILAGWPAETLKKSNTAAGISHYTDEQKLAILLTNLARADGARFAREILPFYVQLHDVMDIPAVSSLTEELEEQKPLQPLIPASELDAVASDFAAFAGSRGIVSHQGFEKRYKKVLKPGGLVAENLYFGTDTSALTIVMALLIDSGVEGYGHRRNILSSMLTHTGIGQAKHRKWDNIVVFSYAVL